MSQVSNSWRDLPPHKNPQNHTQKCSDSLNWHEAHPGCPVSFWSPSPQLQKSPDSPSNLCKNFIHNPEPPATPSKYSSEFQPGRELNSLIQHTADALQSTWESGPLLCMAGVLIPQGNWFQYLQWETKVLYPTCITCNFAHTQYYESLIY